MKFQDIKVDWSGFSEKKRSKVLFAFYANPTYIQQPSTSPPHPTLDHVEHKKLGKICSLLSIVIFQFFEIFNFEYNVLLWKDFGIWNILLKIDFKKKFQFYTKFKRVSLLCPPTLYNFLGCPFSCLTWHKYVLWANSNHYKDLRDFNFEIWNIQIRWTGYNQEIQLHTTLEVQKCLQFWTLNL